jgi:hypothetical protein
MGVDTYLAADRNFFQRRLMAGEYDAYRVALAFRLMSEHWPGILGDLMYSTRDPLVGRSLLKCDRPPLI